VDIVAAVEQGRYVFVEVTDMVWTFIVNDQPDPARLLRVAGAAKALRGDRPVLQFVVNVPHRVGAREGRFRD
jgi:hypothetical protein